MYHIPRILSAMFLHQHIEFAGYAFVDGSELLWMTLLYFKNLEVSVGRYY